MKVKEKFNNKHNLINIKQIMITNNKEIQINDWPEIHSKIYRILIHKQSFQVNRELKH